MVPGAHYGELEQTAQPFIGLSGAGPRVSGMGVFIGAAGELPPHWTARAYAVGAARPPFVTERFVGLDMLAVGPEVVRVDPGLDDLVLLQRVDGFTCPGGA